jgi:hypothetical protein
LDFDKYNKKEKTDGKNHKKDCQKRFFEAATIQYDVVKVIINKYENFLSKTLLMRRNKEIIVRDIRKAVI